MDIKLTAQQKQVLGVTALRFEGAGDAQQMMARATAALQTDLTDTDRKAWTSLQNKSAIAFHQLRPNPNPPKEMRADELTMSHEVEVTIRGEKVFSPLSYCSEKPVRNVVRIDTFNRPSGYLFREDDIVVARLAL